MCITRSLQNPNPKLEDSVKQSQFKDRRKKNQEIILNPIPMETTNKQGSLAKYMKTVNSGLNRSPASKD